LSVVIKSERGGRGRSVDISNYNISRIGNISDEISRSGKCRLGTHCEGGRGDGEGERGREERGLRGIAGLLERGEKSRCRDSEASVVGDFRVEFGRGGIKRNQIKI